MNREDRAREVRDDADFTHRAEMGFSHRELLNGLPAAVAPFSIEKRSNLVYQFDHEKRRVLLTLQPESSRRIHALCIPVTEVELKFFGFSRADFDEFMHRYKRYLHKGGG